MVCGGATPKHRETRWKSGMQRAATAVTGDLRKLSTSSISSSEDYFSLLATLVASRVVRDPPA